MLRRKFGFFKILIKGLNWVIDLLIVVYFMNIIVMEVFNY